MVCSAVHALPGVSAHLEGLTRIPRPVDGGVGGPTERHDPHQRTNIVLGVSPPKNDGHVVLGSAQSSLARSSDLGASAG